MASKLVAKKQFHKTQHVVLTKNCLVFDSCKKETNLSYLVLGSKSHC